jgi:8-oxo-dGTP pyrophosphatase MutT (NUDIX family)
MYICNFEEAVQAQKLSKLKGVCYATLIYLPPQPAVDFGLPTWPPTMLKKELSPRVLLVSTWTDGRWGFIGGGCKKDESPIMAINREFFEETGTEVTFVEEDFCFCDIGDKSAVFTFCKTTTDLVFFNSILSDFYTVARKAYPDEVLSICGYPIWLEGPTSIAEASWGKQIHGLPRHLVANGGFITPTLGNSPKLLTYFYCETLVNLEHNNFTSGKTNVPRFQFLLLLYRQRILDESTLRRVFELSKHFNAPSDLPLPPLEEVLRAALESGSEANKRKVGDAVHKKNTQTKIHEEK